MRHGYKVRLGTRRPGRRAICLLALLGACFAFVPAGAKAGQPVWAVGDGGVSSRGDDRLAGLVGSLGIGRLLYLGDVYEKGTAREFQEFYTPGWGRFREITHPTPGNHEWSARATGYDRYWGRRARGAKGAHYYSFDLGAWHVVSLNSQEDSRPSSSQVRWLRQDLARYGGTCTMAFWHRPRYNAGEHGEAKDVEPLWAALNGRATVVLNGHDHNYQRFKRVRGITQFVAGAGGKTPLYEVDRSDSRLAASQDSSLGALRLDLDGRGLGFRYTTVEGAVRDSGRIRCRAHRPVVVIDLRDGVSVDPGTQILTGRARGYHGPLRVSLVRRAPGGACSRFDGIRFRATSCGSRGSFALRDAGGWRISLPADKALGPGRYELTVRASDPARRRGRATVSFQVR